MSLYGDLPQAKDEDAASKGWAGSSKKLQPTFRPKQAGGSSSLLGVPPSVRAGGAGRTGGRIGSSDGGRGGGRGPPPVANVSASAMGSGIGPGPVMPGGAAHSQHSSFSFLKALNGDPLKDEYDPSKPNDYEDIMKEREKRKKAAEEEAERAARLREAEQVRWCAGAGKQLSWTATYTHDVTAYGDDKLAISASTSTAITSPAACRPHCTWCLCSQRLSAAGSHGIPIAPCKPADTCQLDSQVWLVGVFPDKHMCVRWCCPPPIHSLTLAPTPSPPTHYKPALCLCRKLSGASGSKQKQQPSLQQQASLPLASSPLQSQPQQMMMTNLSSREALAQRSSSSTRQTYRKQQGQVLAQQQLRMTGWMIMKGSGSGGSSCLEMKHLLRGRGSAGGLECAAVCIVPRRIRHDSFPSSKQ